LRQDYGAVIAQVFPQAVHHVCLFHALQDVQQHIKDVYGADYAAQYPEAEDLKQQIYAILDAHTLARATKRYTDVLALRRLTSRRSPRRPGSSISWNVTGPNWPIVSASARSRPPTTRSNWSSAASTSTTSLSWPHRPGNFCGFESPTDAQRYLAVFEKIYRFTPFSQDAQPRIRGKSPLQLAGYDVASLPMATLCAGLSIVWPMTAEVPNP
jgi:hypothetical protein